MLATPEPALQDVVTMATLVHRTASRWPKAALEGMPAGIGEAVLILVLGLAILALREAGLLTPALTTPLLQYGYGVLG